jgi:hypothetical protein
MFNRHRLYQKRKLLERLQIIPMMTSSKYYHLHRLFILLQRNGYHYPKEIKVIHQHPIESPDYLLGALKICVKIKNKLFTS